MWEKLMQCCADLAITTRRNLMGLHVDTDYHDLLIESGKVIQK